MILQCYLLLQLMDQLHTDVILVVENIVKAGRIIYMKIKHYAKSAIPLERVKLEIGYLNLLKNLLNFLLLKNGMEQLVKD